MKKWPSVARLGFTVLASKLMQLVDLTSWKGVESANFLTFSYFLAHVPGSFTKSSGVFRCLCHSLPRCPKLIRRNTMDYEIVWECLSFKPAIAADGTSTANFVPYLSNRTPALRLLFRSGQIYGIKVWDFRIDGWFMLFPPFLLPLRGLLHCFPLPPVPGLQTALCGIYLIAEHAIINKNNPSLIRQVMTTHDNYYT